jgi:hypothetical protein
MRGRAWRFLVVGLASAVVAAACGDHGGGSAATTTPLTIGGGTTTSASWGAAVAPGAEAMLEGSRLLLREDFQDGDTAGWDIASGWYLLVSFRMNRAVLCSQDGDWTSGSIVCPVPAQPAGVHDWGVYVDAEDEVEESDPIDGNNGKWGQLQL